MACSRQKDIEPPCDRAEDSMNNLTSHNQSASETQVTKSSKKEIFPTFYYVKIKKCDFCSTEKLIIAKKTLHIY